MSPGTTTTGTTTRCGRRWRSSRCPCICIRATRCQASASSTKAGRSSSGRRAFAIETGTHALRLITSGLFDRYPRLQIVLGHLGEFLPFAIHRFEQRLSRIPSVRLERGPSEVLRENFHVTTSGNYHTPSLRACIEQLGAERLLFAADYPFEVLDEGTSWFDALELDDDVKTLIGSRNAARLFALDVPFRSAGDSAR